MGVLNLDIARQLGATTLGARLWRLQPGQTSTRHRHRRTNELYVLLEGTGRIRVDASLHTLTPLSSVLVDATDTRQFFNDTESEQLWLIVGAPPEPASTREMTPQELAWVCPDGTQALPPELQSRRSGQSAESAALT